MTSFRSRSRSTRGPQSLASLVTFLIVLIIGLIQLGGSAPFWQMLVVALVAGVTGLAVGLVTLQRMRSGR